MDSVSFVKSLELHDADDFAIRRTSVKLLHSDSDKKSKAFVDAGSLVSFTENLSGQNKADVLNSTLLAQLAASKKFDRQTDSANWYKMYSDILMHVGWVTQQFQFTQYQSQTTSFEMSAVVMDLLLALVGDAEPALIEVVKATLDAFKKSGQQTIMLFDSKSVSGNHGNFQIVPCTVDKGGQVVMKFVGAFFAASKVDCGFLFFKYSNSDIQLMKATDSLTLNEEAYSKVRQAIVDKLGDRANAFVDSLDI